MSAIIEVFRVLATIMSILMYLSPIPTMIEIRRNKSTGPMPFVPLVTMVSNAHVWTIYGWLAENIFPIFATCAFGMVISSVYVAIYYQHTTEKAYARKIIAVFTCVVIINSVYPILGASGYTNQSYEGVKLTVGYIAAVSSVVMYTSPFEKVRLVFKHRSGVFIPIQIVVVGSINSLSWVVLSLLELDLQVAVPNAILLVIGLVQIALYWVFHPSKHPLQPGAIDGDVALGAKELDVRPSAAVFEAAGKEASFVALRSPV